MGLRDIIKRDTIERVIVYPTVLLAAVLVRGLYHSNEKFESLNKRYEREITIANDFLRAGGVIIREKDEKELIYKRALNADDIIIRYYEEKLKDHEKKETAAKIRELYYREIIKALIGNGEYKNKQSVPSSNRVLEKL